MPRVIRALSINHPTQGEYLVINLTMGGRPTVAHSTLFDAQREATRLADLNVGQMFTVVQVSDSRMASAEVRTYC